MRIIITEEQKNKLFIPRKLSDNDSRYSDWNNSQPIIDGKRINQYDVDGKKQGYWEHYDENGELESKGVYKNDLRDGYWEYFHENGELWSKGNYINGKKDGYWEYYYSNGYLHSKGNYKDGWKDGYWEQYSNGQLIDTKTFKKGILITENEGSKNKLFIPRKIEGEGSRWEQWNNSQPIIDGIQINQYDMDGKEQGYWEYYYDNGNLHSKGNYINGLRVGYWENYYDNGQLQSKGNYKDGKQDGIWEEYFRDGEFWYEGEYKDGKYIRDIRI